MYTVAEVAKRLRVSSGLIYAAIEDGRLKAYRLGRGGALRISDDNLREYLDSSMVEKEEASQPTMKLRHLGL